ncbi:MAG: PEP-CTERM sorting domain-containing protein [Gemmatimonadetes bacterium]|nr:PEP-CTERM sorting domain-containing protein [Gemmatimonadota bacterium]
MTLRLWNLSGFYSTNPNTVFTAVGFQNVGSAMADVGSLTMSGPVRPGDSPSSWRIRNDVTAGGGVFLDLLTQTPDGNANDGIASGCASNLPPGQYWQNPCSLPSSINDPGYVQLNFTITGSWDLQNTIVNVHGNNRGEETDCITGGELANCFGASVPEPVTMTLMLTGLAGMGGFGLIRRRRGKDVTNG